MRMQKVTMFVPLIGVYECDAAELAAKMVATASYFHSVIKRRHTYPHTDQM